MRQFPHIPHAGRTGRMSVLPVRPASYDAQNLPV
nr:MAG TPA: hypothetical protein [Caudoviricetes sp.]